MPAARFWVGGTGTWDSTTTTHWSASSGGAGGASAPVTGDAPNFDANSGAGTVTLDSTLNGLSFGSLTATAFTGTLDNTVNNVSLTFTAATNGISIGSTGILKLGSGTFTFAAGGFSNTSSSAQSFASSTLIFNSNSNSGTQTFAGGAATFGTVTINGRTTGQSITFSGINTFGTLNLNGPLVAAFTVAQTITNLNVNGTITQFVFFPAVTTSGTTVALTVTSANVNFGILRGAAFAGAAVNALNSIDMGDNTMNGGSITPPASGGGARMISG